MKCGRNSEVLGLQDQKEKCDVKIVSAGEKGLNLNYAYEMRDVKFADTKGKKIRSNEFFGKR